MNYVVECPYCGKTYIVDVEPSESLSCPACGAANDCNNIVRKEDDTAKETSKPERKFLLGNDEQHKEDAILAYRKRQEAKENDSFTYSSVSPEDDFDSSRVLGLTVSAISIFLLIIWIIAQVNSSSPSSKSAFDNYYNEAHNELIEAGNRSSEATEIRALIKQLVTATGKEDYSAIFPFIYGYYEYPWLSYEDLVSLYKSSYFSLFWGDTSIQCTDIEYVSGYPLPYAYRGLDSFSHLNIEPYQKFKVTFSNGKTREFSFCKNEFDNWAIELDFRNALKDVKLTVPGENLTFSIDGITLNTSYPPEIVLDENGFPTSVYTIPYLFPREYHFVLETDYESIEQTITIESSSNNILSFSSANEVFLASFQETLKNTWTEVISVSLNYGYPNDIRHYFSTAVTDEDLESLMQYIRMKIGTRGDYEGAILVDIEPIESLQLLSPNTYLAKVTIHYTSSSQNHPAGSYEALISMELSEDTWYINHLFDYSFFTIDSTKPVTSESGESE